MSQAIQNRYEFVILFDVRNGKVTRAPATVPIAAFPVKEEDGHIFTRDNRFD